MAAPRILIVRTGALGDVVHALPVLGALRRSLPAARLGWVVEEPFAPLLAGHPDLDEIIVIATRRWRRRPWAPSTWRGVAHLLADLHRFAAEVVLDLMGNHKAGALAALTLAERRLGPARTDRREPSSALWIDEPVAVRGEHAVDRWLSLLEPLGLEPGPADFGGPKLLPGEPAGGPAEAPSPDPLVLVHPGAGWENKRYPPELWGEAVGLLARRTPVDVRAVPGPGEEALAERLVAHSGGAAAVATAPDLPSLAALQRRAALVLGGDTGPVHLAHALGVPVLCLMGPTDPARNGPYGAPEAALWRRLPCSFCHRRLEAPKACLLDLHPAEVAGRALERLAAGRGGPPGPGPTNG